MAAEQGFAPAQVAIGEIYLTGDGMEQDKDEAGRWFEMAADQGDPTVRRIMETLADVAREGRGM